MTDQAPIDWRGGNEGVSVPDSGARRLAIAIALKQQTKDSISVLRLRDKPGY